MKIKAVQVYSVGKFPVIVDDKGRIWIKEKDSWHQDFDLPDEPEEKMNEASIDMPKILERIDVLIKGNPNPSTDSSLQGNILGLDIYND